MTEFIGLDLEMAFEEHYHEVMETIDGMLKSIFAGLQTKFSKEIETIQKQHPHEPFTWLDETLVLSYAQAIGILREGNVLQNGQEIGDEDDMRLVSGFFSFCIESSRY